jgi:hypothetical protein
MNAGILAATTACKSACMNQGILVNPVTPEPEPEAADFKDSDFASADFQTSDSDPD